MTTQNIEEYAKRSYFYTEKLPFLLNKYINQIKFNSILDVGCGDGSHLDSLEKKGFLKEKRVFATDLSKNRITLVKKRFPLFNCVICDACDLGIIKNKIDLIISTQVIEHVTNDEKMIKEVYKKLNSRGYFYLSTVFKKKWAIYFYRCNKKWVLDPTHIREYTNEENLLEKLKKNGFKIIETNKNKIQFPIIDPFLRILKIRDVEKNWIVHFLRKIKITIPGYYEWEILCQKIKK
jgi:2-polyprenyl-3-methyl-5-hydroxy-6-metoxy-1,4-benzoquinol methylase